MKMKAVIFEILKILTGIVFISPILIACLAAVMPKESINAMPFTLNFQGLSFDSLIYAVKNLNLNIYVKNTFVMVMVTVPMQIITSLLAAYAFSHFEFRFKNLLFTIMLASMMVPGEVIIVTNYKTIMRWGLIDTYLGLVITSLVSSSAVFMFRQTMASMPKSLWDAARIDGCGNMRYFTQILSPMCKSTIVAYALRGFIAAYNSYMWPMLVTTTPKMQTIQSGIVRLYGSEHEGIVMAAAMFTSLIPILVFSFGMDKITEGMTAGAVKN